MGHKSHSKKDLHSPAELKWIQIQPFLLQHGYKLRPRYDPRWKPSWKKLWNFYKDKFDCPDHIQILRPYLIDAVRVRDSTRVVIKRVNLEYDNVPLLQYLNTTEIRKDPRNNAVPLLDVIPLPNHESATQEDDVVLLVMPMLFPFISCVPFRHVREVIEALDQLIQGLVFLHEHRIAHRDACELNYMMDATNVIPVVSTMPRTLANPMENHGLNTKIDARWHQLDIL